MWSGMGFFMDSLKEKLMLLLIVIVCGCKLSFVIVMLGLFL